MRVSRVKLHNWRNFTNAEAPDLPDIVYLIGPNASGKSNFLDALHFLKDIAKPVGGGLQQAVSKRGGMRKLRCLYAEKDSDIQIEIDVSDDEDNLLWTYSLSFNSSRAEQAAPRIVSESLIDHASMQLVDLIGREFKGSEDLDDGNFQQTYIEQTVANQKFRGFVDYLSRIRYFHLVPQFLRFSDQISGRTLDGDPFGQEFLNRISSTDPKIRASRICKIENSLKSIIPGLEKFSFVDDNHFGKPHLEAKFKHHMHNGAKQWEDQLSDGILRLIAILWTCYEFSGRTILIEEPEISLSGGIVEDMHALFRHSLNQSENGGQLFLSTHNASLLSDLGIDTHSFIIFELNSKGSWVRKAAEPELDAFEADIPASDAVLGRVENAVRLNFGI